MDVRIITPPTVEPLTLAEAKQHLEVTHSDRDEYIQSLIKTAREHLEWSTNQAFVQRTLELVLDRFPYNCRGDIDLLIGPVQSITSIKYNDSAGVEQTISSGSYTLSLLGRPRLIPLSTFEWPSLWDEVDAVRVRYVAGYAASTDSPPDPLANIPESARHAMRLLIGSWFEHRESEVVVLGQTVQALPYAFEALSAQLRVYR